MTENQTLKVLLLSENGYVAFWNESPQSHKKLFQQIPKNDVNDVNISAFQYLSGSILSTVQKCLGVGCFLS